MSVTAETLLTKTIELKYDATEDVLIAEWPHVTEGNIAELKASMELLLSYVRENQVKNLLIDVRNSEVVIPSAEYNTLLAWFILELTDTNLRKIARVNPADYVRKNVLDKTEIDVYKKDYSVIFEEYTNYKEAYCWLGLSIL